MKDGRIGARNHGSGTWAGSALALVAALGLAACKPAPCGPTRDVRHRAKIAFERYPHSGDEARAVLKELSAAIAAQPKGSSLDWTRLNESIPGFAKSLDDMANPNIDDRQRPHVGPVMKQRKEGILYELDRVRTQCGD